MNKAVHYIQWLTILMMVFLIVGQYTIANDLGIRGQDMSQIEQKIQLLHDENEILMKEYSTLTSLDQIALRAKDLGFDIPGKMLHIPQVQNVALR